MNPLQQKIITKDIGKIDYAQAWNYQKKLFKKKLNNKIEGRATKNYLLFCEHSHVYTLGKSGSENNLLVNNEQLKKMGISFFKTNRGGDITYHGPGQIVGYPIIDLDNFNLGIRSYIELLEESIISVLADFGLKGKRFGDATGVWLDVDKPGGSPRKICAIGVKASRHITMHGFSFNVNTDLSFFDFINPCGFTDKNVTSMEEELRVKQDFKKVLFMVENALLVSFRATAKTHIGDC